MKKKRVYSSQQFYGDVYINGYEDTPQEKIEAAFRSKDVAHYRMKTVFAGDICECEIYPVWNTKNKQRTKRAKEIRLSQRNLNDKNARKKLVRLMNANFTTAHTWATVTYSDDKLPLTKEDADKSIKNYMRRLAYYAKRNGLEPLKFIYVTEWCNDPKKKQVRCHHHIVLNLENRDTVDSLWYGGNRTEVRRLQPDELGLEGLGRYLKKDPHGSKRYVCSKNLTKPIEITANMKISKRKAQLIAKSPNDAPEIFSKVYPDYIFTDIATYFPDDNEGLYGGTYIYVRMRKSEPTIFTKRATRRQSNASEKHNRKRK